jgi:hypothetical protein
MVRTADLTRKFDSQFLVDQPIGHSAALDATGGARFAGIKSVFYRAGLPMNCGRNVL